MNVNVTRLVGPIPTTQGFMTILSARPFIEPDAGDGGAADQHPYERKLAEYVHTCKISRLQALHIVRDWHPKLYNAYRRDRRIGGGELRSARVREAEESAAAYAHSTRPDRGPAIPRLDPTQRAAIAAALDLNAGTSVTHLLRELCRRVGRPLPERSESADGVRPGLEILTELLGLEPSASFARIVETIRALPDQGAARGRKRSGQDGSGEQGTGGTPGNGGTGGPPQGDYARSHAGWPELGESAYADAVRAVIAARGVSRLEALRLVRAEHPELYTDFRKTQLESDAR